MEAEFLEAQVHMVVLAVVVVPRLLLLLEECKAQVTVLVLTISLQLNMHSPRVLLAGVALEVGVEGAGTRLVGG